MNKDNDPFYSESNMNYLKKIVADIENGTAKFVEHEPIEVEDDEEEERGPDGTRLEDFLEEQLKDPDFKKEWDALEPDFAAIQAKIDAERDQRVIDELEEDKEDLIAYAKAMAAYRKNPVTHTFDEVIKELGLDEEKED